MKRALRRYWKALVPIEMYRGDEWGDELIVRIGRPHWPHKYRLRPGPERVVNMTQIIGSIDVTPSQLGALLKKIDRQ